MSQNRSVDVPSVLPANWAEHCQGNGYNDYGQECPGYGDAQWPCRTCAAYQERDIQNSAGFVETNERVKETNSLMNMDTDNFPVTLICYRGEKAIPVLHVRMDSIRVKESIIPGYVNVEYEGYGTSITGTVPMVDYYTTESE